MPVTVACNGKKARQEESPRNPEQKTLTPGAEKSLVGTGSTLPHFYSVCSLQIGRESTQKGISGPREEQPGKDHGWGMEKTPEVLSACSVPWLMAGKGSRHTGHSSQRTTVKPLHALSWGTAPRQLGEVESDGATMNGSISLRSPFVFFSLLPLLHLGGGNCAPPLLCHRKHR